MSKTVLLYDGRLTLSIPDAFRESENSEKYFQGGKPDKLYAAEESGALISVTLTDIPGDALQLEERIGAYYNLYKRSVPNFANANVAKKKAASGTELAAFYYTSTAPEKDLYNLVVLTFLEGREVLVTMHCNLQDVPRYGMTFMQVLNSVDILKD